MLTKPLVHTLYLKPPPPPHLDGAHLVRELGRHVAVANLGQARPRVGQVGGVGCDAQGGDSCNCQLPQQEAWCVNKWKRESRWCCMGDTDTPSSSPLHSSCTAKPPGACTRNQPGAAKPQPTHLWCTGATAPCTRTRQTAARAGCAAQWWSAPPGRGSSAQNINRCWSICRRVPKCNPNYIPCHAAELADAQASSVPPPAPACR